MKFKQLGINIAVTSAVVAGSFLVNSSAQALSLNGSVTITDIFLKVEDDLNSIDDKASFNFQPSINLPSGIQITDLPFGIQTASTGDFIDTIIPLPLVKLTGPLNVAGGTLSPELNPFISKIKTKGGPVNFVLESISNYEENFGSTVGTKRFDFNLNGYFTDGLGNISGSGVFASTVNTKYGKGSMSATLVTDVTEVPTPALLPGLIGMAATALRKKRKGEMA